MTCCCQLIGAVQRGSRSCLCIGPDYMSCLSGSGMRGRRMSAVHSLSRETRMSRDLGPLPQSAPTPAADNGHRRLLQQTDACPSILSFVFHWSHWHCAQCPWKRAIAETVVTDCRCGFTAFYGALAGVWCLHPIAVGRPGAPMYCVAPRHATPRRR